MLQNTYEKTNEKKWMKYWEDNQIYKFNENDHREVFSIDTPPPTVSGSIHIGHIFSYTQAEIMARYNRLKGLNVFYPFGFDDNGLPTERLVEKENNIKAKDLNREDFIGLCLKTTEKYEHNFELLFKRLGISADWSLKYSSIDERSRRTSQRSFIDLVKKDAAYFSTDPVLWCTECETSIAQAETESKLVKSTFNHLKFKTTSNEEFIVATTRPEFLGSCVAIFVNPNNQTTSHLIGKEAVVPLYNFKVPIIADDLVQINKGTGIVMCCTFGDTTDIIWWKKYQLPLKELFDNDGIILSTNKLLKGFKVESARIKILELLQENDCIVKTEDITHEISTHERCGLEHEFKVKKGWFIKTLDIKDDLIEYGKKINWHPAHMEARYKDWVNNLAWDWAISRQRFFGVAFPVWYCNNCKAIILADDADLPIDPLTSKPNHPCSKCGGNDFTAETDIMDTWATSSVSQLVNMKWGEKDSLESQLLPMSLRPNAHDIIRTWDFYSIVKNYYHFKQTPWNNLMISGFVMADKGEKISKRKSNSKFEPINAINEYSADVVRYWAASGRLGSDIVFSEETMKIGSKLVNKLYNAAKLVTMHLENYQDKSFADFNIIDTWILEEFNIMANQYNKYLDKYEIGLALNILEKFFWNFCDNYLEIVKHRLYKKDVFGGTAHYSAQKTIFVVLYDLLQKFAPFIPFVTEEIYQNFYRDYKEIISIHNTVFEQLPMYINSHMLGESFIEILSYIRAQKTRAKLSLKAEVKTLEILVNKSNMGEFKLMSNDLKETLNIINLYLISSNINNYKINKLEFADDSKKQDNFDLITLLEKQKKSLITALNNSKNILANENFINKAPEQIVNDAKTNLRKYQSEINDIDKKIENLK